MHLKGLILKLLLLSTLVAAGIPEARSSVKVKLGVNLSAWYPIMWTDTNGSTAQFKARIGVEGGLNLALHFGEWFTLQPEVLLGYSKIGIDDQPHRFKSDVKSFTVQVPILAMVRLGIFRIGAGPVLTVLDEPHYNVYGSRTLFGRLYPTLSYAFCLSLRLSDHFDLGLRYLGTFNSMTNYYSYDLIPGNETMIKTRMRQIKLKVSFHF